MLFVHLRLSEHDNKGSIRSCFIEVLKYSSALYKYTFFIKAV
jgi:hypothetical protein